MIEMTMEWLHENPWRLAMIGVTIFLIFLYTGNSNRFLSITTQREDVAPVIVKQGATVRGGKTPFITFLDVISVRINTIRDGDLVNSHIFATDSEGNVYSFGYYRGGGWFTLNTNEIKSIKNKTISFGSTYNILITTISYTESLSIEPIILPFYRQSATVLIPIQSITQAGLKITLLFNNKQDTKFTNSSGYAIFSVDIPDTIGQYTATVSAIDPWNGNLVKRDFIIIVRPVTVITWDKEKIAYTGDLYKIRFNVQDANNRIVEPSFMPTVSATLNNYDIDVETKYIATGIYEVSVTPTLSGKLEIIASTYTYGLEPSSEHVLIDVIKSVAKITHNINTEETFGSNTYTISVTNPRNNPIDAQIVVTIDEPLGSRTVIEPTRISIGKYAIVYTTDMAGVYYWSIDVIPNTAIDPVFEKITMNVISNKNPASEIGVGILQSPTFSFSIIGIIIVGFIVIIRMRRQQQL